jgi:hypothetical protein
MGLLTSLLSTPPGLPIGRAIHRRVLARQPRSQSLATSFFRNLKQLGVLEGPLAGIAGRRPLRVLVAGCSLGCEAYALAGFLRHRLGVQDFAVTALDIDPEAVAFGAAGIYAAAHLPTGAARDEARDLIAQMFAQDGDAWRIRDDLKAHMTFMQGDVLAPAFAGLGRFDLVLGQNFLIHMDDAMARRALATLADRVDADGAIFLSGVDLDLRVAEATRNGLRPIDWNIKALHEEDHVRRGGWPWAYWGLEPFSPGASDPVRRYATIYRRAMA